MRFLDENGVLPSYQLFSLGFPTRRSGLSIGYHLLKRPATDVLSNFLWME
jgi:hypothetical protein